MQQPVPTSLLIGIAALVPALIVGFWLLITMLLSGLAGLNRLASHFPDRDESPLLSLTGQSGAMGPGINMRNILLLEACGSGLRIAVSRFLAPFAKPFLVPWGEIVPTPKRALFVKLARLGLGRPEIGVLTIDVRLWERLAAVTPAAPRIAESTGS